MRKIMLLTIAVFLATAAAWCGEANDSIIFVVIDYTHGTYVGYTYMQVQQEEPMFDGERLIYASKFVEGVNSSYKCKMRVLGEYEEPEKEDASLTLSIKYVDEEGIIEAIMEYQKGKEYHRRNIRSKYSPFGTWMGNFGDGMKSLGEQAGNWLANGFK